MAIYFGSNARSPESPPPPPPFSVRTSKEKVNLTDNEKQELKTELLTLVKHLTSLGSYDSENLNNITEIVRLLLDKFS